jgi:hypothetical protein
VPENRLNVYRLSEGFLCSFSIKQEIHMIVFLLVLATTLGFLSGSVWLFSIALGTLMVKMFPILLVAIALVGGGLLAFRYYMNK